MSVNEYPISSWLGCFALGLLGAALGAWLVARRVRAELAVQFRTRLHEAFSSAQPPWHLPLQGTDPPSNETDRSIEIVQAVQTAVSSTLADVEATLSQWVQQAIQVELEFFAQQQAEREEARALEQRRWQVEKDAQDERGAAEIRALGRTTSVLPVDPPVQRKPLTSASPGPALSTRSPDLTPVRQPMCRSDERELDLSDDEIDALPAELPILAKPRKRILPAPTKPTFRNL